MLTLIAIFLATIIASATSVWLYRKITDLDSFRENLDDRSRSKDNSKIKSQKGFSSMVSMRGEKVKDVRLRKSIADIKTPWGW